MFTTDNLITASYILGGLFLLLKLRNILIFILFICESIYYSWEAIKDTFIILAVLGFVSLLRIPIVSIFTTPAFFVLSAIIVFFYPYFILKEAVRRYLYEHKHIESFTHAEKLERGYLPSEQRTIYSTVAVEVTENEDGSGDIVIDVTPNKNTSNDPKEEVKSMDASNCLEYFDKFKGA